uniref:Uncharacterized protein n=1 Tax=Oryza glumipatula TaxID=40148 RepID=A0A0E0BID8_9ORYZ
MALFVLGPFLAKTEREQQGRRGARSKAGQGRPDGDQGRERQDSDVLLPAVTAQDGAGVSGAAWPPWLGTGS